MRTPGSVSSVNIPLNQLVPALRDYPNIPVGVSKKWIKSVGGLGIKLEVNTENGAVSPVLGEPAPRPVAEVD